MAIKSLLLVGVAAAAPCPTMSPTATPAAAEDAYRRNLRRGLTSVECNPYAPIANYQPLSDVTEHADIDYDMIDLKAYLAEDPVNYANAIDIYSNGNHSRKTSSIRTLRGFSTGADSKMNGEEFYPIYKAYFGSATYADDYVMAALQGTAWSSTPASIDYSSAVDVTRVESAQKGAAYLNVWMYVLHECEDALSDCAAGDIADNDGGVHAWDEGWAFYAGATAPDGKLLYELAEKRCENYATCTGDNDNDPTGGTSSVNKLALQYFEDGKTALNAFECATATTALDKIKVQMKIPLMQGMLRYAYKADPNGGAGGDKEIAEGWTFAMSLLPLINQCDASVATKIVTNMLPGATAPMVDGWESLKSSVESTYACLGLVCDDIGGLVNDVDANGMPVSYLMDACITTVSAGTSVAAPAAFKSLAIVGAALFALAAL